MSYVAPNSTVEIFTGGNVPLDPNYENTLVFNNITEQNTWFSNLNRTILTEQSYQRVNKGSIKVSLGVNNNSINTLFRATYMRFKNNSFENKWFYCFIDKVEYINNNTVQIFYHLDVIQTFMFNWSFEQCLIEREHTATDVAGEHTLPEQLETGPYRSYPGTVYLEDSASPTGLAYMYNRFEYVPCVVLACALDNEDVSKYTYGVLMPGIASETGQYYSGVRYYAYRLYGGGAVQGIYQFNFAGTWHEGDLITVNGNNCYISATAAANNSNLAEYVASYINQYISEYSAARTDYGVMTVYESNGYYGTGIPDIQTNNASGQIYPYIVQDGSAGGEYGDIHKLNRALEAINNNAKTDAIVGMFMMPQEFYPHNSQELINGVSPLTMRVIVPLTIDNSYIPRNKKLYTAPYNMMYVTNNTGMDAEYKFEDFIKVNSNEGTYCRFKIWGNLSMNPGMYCAPYYFNGNNMPAGATDDEVIVTGFPMCSYNIDSFKAWLAQNAGTIIAAGTGIVANWAQLIGGTIATAYGAGNMAGSVGSNVPKLPGNIAEPSANTVLNANIAQPSNGLLAATFGALGQLYDHSRRPPQVHGQNNANLAYQGGQLTFTWYYKQIKEEYAKIIDAFFDMYGYKVNRVGVPNLMARPCYTYVKTVGCSVDGLIPGDFKKQIEAVFDKGIRFWKTNAVYGNFDPLVNNNTV